MTTDLPGLPSASLGRWLAVHVPELLGDRPWSAQFLSGGLSNLTYRLQLAGGRVVLRRPPLGPVLPRAHDMAREARVLTALAASGVPVPPVLAVCLDSDVVGAPFYLMAEVEGRVLRTADDTRLLSQGERESVADQLAQTLVTLHSVDVDDVGLGDFGRRHGYALRQVKTWGAQWNRSRTRSLPAMDRLLRRLADGLPAERGSGLVHGDYRLDNTVFHLATRPTLVAVLDWELSTIGEPAADLGLALTYWRGPDDVDDAGLPVGDGATALPGFPSRLAMAERYSALTGDGLDDLPFYLALGAMKLAVILEGVHGRYLGGQTVGAGYATAGEAVPRLVQRGLRLLASGSID